MQTRFTTDFLMTRGDFTGKVIRFFEVPLVPDSLLLILGSCLCFSVLDQFDFRR